MHTDNTPSEKPTGDGNPTAGNTDSQPVSNPVDADKVFHSLRAAYALHGHELHRTDPTDGTVTYFSRHWGRVRSVPNIAAAQWLLERIGSLS
jgi:hypothetical protein